MTAEVYTEERLFIRETGNHPRYPRVSRALARVEPGVTTQHHALIGVTEVYILIRGGAVMHRDGVPDRSVGPGDVVRIRPGQGQSITNTGTGALMFECLCTPRFTPDAYQTRE